MKAIRLFSMAALALMMGACSTEEIEQAPQQPAKAEGVIEFTGTIAKDGATRTAMTESGSSINVEWSLTETIHLFQDDYEYGTATIASVDGETGMATIEGTLTTSGYDLSQSFDLKIFGASASEADLMTALQDQKGTLENMGDYDWREGSGKLVLNTETNKYELQGKVTMASKIAIWKLTLKDYYMQDLYIPKTTAGLRLYADGQLVGTCNNFAGGGSKNDAYLAVPPISSAPIAIIYTDGPGTNKYLFQSAGVTLAANTYYQSVVDMGEPQAMMGNMVFLGSKSGEITLNNGDILTGTGGGETHVTIAAGASVTLQDVDITSITKYWSGITCAGNATINLAGTNKLWYGGGSDSRWSGIFIPDGFTLTIDGTGNLEARGCEGAGIGGGYGKTGGNIIIKGGTITASSEHGAGIGCADEGTCGNITINGGTITADISEETSNNSAGIGGGGFQGTCGNITITGGTVNAKSGAAGACIGSGWRSTCGNITISGSTTVVNALGSEEYSTGIGAGESANCGTITISGGDILATGGKYAAAIGTSGYRSEWDSQHSTCDEIYISGGTVVATAGNSAATAIGKAEEDAVCPKVRIQTPITSLTLKNASATDKKVSNFVNATKVFANSAEITAGLSLDVDGTEITTNFPYFGFNTSYDTTMKTWTLTTDSGFLP